MVLTLGPHPKTLALNWYAKLFRNFFLIKASLSERYEINSNHN
jgi:hypothetical protein